MTGFGNSHELSQMPQRRRGGNWRRGASGVALAVAIAHAPVLAQTSAILRASAGLTSPVIAPPTPVVRALPVAPNAAGMTSASARAIANQARVANATSLAVQANTAAREAARAVELAPPPAMPVPNGLVAGGLVPVAIADQRLATQDPTGLRTWQGASQPVQTGDAATPTVTITQTSQRALLSWQQFNIGLGTTLEFKQQPGWVVVNRIAENINETTGRIALGTALSPSKILGTIKGDGTVVVINQNGVMFGGTAEVNTQSFLASSLDLGPRLLTVGSTSTATGLQLRGVTFLQSGLLASNFLVSSVTTTVPTQAEGAVTVAAGASISSGKGGFVILTAPQVVNDGHLRSLEGQVSLQSGGEIIATPSSGGDNSVDRDVRGLILASIGSGADSVTSGTVDPANPNRAATALIDAPRGYVSLGGTVGGSISNAGVITATTSVSRNGKIALTGASVTLAPGSTLSIAPDAQRLPDGSFETIPQSAESVADFRRSVITIGSSETIGLGSSETPAIPAGSTAVIAIGAGTTIYAPSANVTIGARNDLSTDLLSSDSLASASSLVIGANVTIDVGGIKDFIVEASRNSVEISPAKRNELRDTPNYREALTPEEEAAGVDRFTLNGATLFIDPRLSGVRADGVRWVGSPLIEGESIAGQIAVTAPELMTRGGNLSLGVRIFEQGSTRPLPTLSISNSAILDVSGGWVTYQAGVVKTSRLQTADGRLVAIGAANPNDNFVAVVNNIEAQQPRFGFTANFGNPAAEGFDFEPGYTEGRDAGAVVIKGSTFTAAAGAPSLAATIHADAFAGTRQIADAREASVASTAAVDLRNLQATPAELPSGGLLRIQAVVGGAGAGAGGADIVVYDGAGAVGPRSNAEILLADDYLTGAGLSALALQTSGRVSFKPGTDLRLQAGGALVVDAGRSILFDGDIRVPSGTITAQTYDIASGSVFTTADDRPALIGFGAATPKLFDVTVNGLVSARGLWTNDLLVTDGAYLGSAFADGGSIRLQVAPRVLIPIAAQSGGAPEFAADLSGSLVLNTNGRLDVAGGGYVRPDATLSLTGRGGDVALINETIYISPFTPFVPSNRPPARGIEVDRPAFVVTPDPDRLSSLTPRASESGIVLLGTIEGHGFSGGGRFTLVAPDLNFGARAGESGTAIARSFINDSGFGAFTFTTYTTRFIAPIIVDGVEVNGVFDNGINGTVALLDTEIIRIGNGETLDLTQSVTDNLVPGAFGDVARQNQVSSQIEAARNLASDADIVALLGTGVPDDPFDRRAVDLTFGGLTEVAVERGGSITGSDGAVLTTPKLFNAGTIRLPGGVLRQAATLPTPFTAVNDTRRAIGVSGLAGADGLATVFGERNAIGLFEESNTVRDVPIFDGINSVRNDDVAASLTLGRVIFLTAQVGQADGMVLAGGSMTNLSGASIRNPRAGARPGGAQKIEGRIVDAGSIEAVQTQLTGLDPLAPLPAFGTARVAGTLNSPAPIGQQRQALALQAEPGAVINLQGADDRYDLETALGLFELAPVWSRGGRLTLNAGGSLGGATIFADGGDRVSDGGLGRGEGGVLTWLNPRLTQADADDLVRNVVAANQIAAAGFDTFVALDSLTTVGNATLALGRGFHLQSRPFEGAGELTSYTANLATTGNLLIDAPYIRLASPQQAIVALRLPVGAPTGSVTLRGNSIDIVGSTYASGSITDLNLIATGDVRLTGVQPAARTLGGSIAGAASLAGQLIVSGNLTIRAAQVYATTGTGSLQQNIDTARAGTGPTAAAYRIGSTGTDATIRFEGQGFAPPTPYSAGANLLVQATNIEQFGVVRTPLGRLVLGASTTSPVPVVSGPPTFIPATESVILGAGSVTSVSASVRDANGQLVTLPSGGLDIPYGTTTDLLEYFFAPASDNRVFAPPSGDLRLAADSIDVRQGATVDGSGGGDIYAYEFVPGVGGSRDVLDRFNSDPFSGNSGLQFADGRQVYAIVPSLRTAGAALIDPIYSADYGALYSPADAARQVFLEAGPGIAAGWYTLLPARYALLPGGLRIVENVGDAPPALGISSQLRDGSVQVGGYYGVAGTSFEDSQRHTFTVQDQASFSKFSKVVLTPGSATFKDLATRDGLAVPRLPVDAARLVLNPISELAINTRFLTDPAFSGDPAKSGRGAQVDITGTAFEILAPGALETGTGVITLTATELNNLNAASLLIGGVRTDKGDGTTALQVATQSIRVAEDAAFSAAEVVLVVDGPGSSISVEDGAVISASGTVNDDRTGNYVITASDDTGLTAIGGMLRVANGPERLLARPGARALANSLEDTTIAIGEATLTGQVILIDTSRDLVITDDPLTPGRPTITARDALALGLDDVFFTTAPSGYRGLVITPELEDQFNDPARLTIISKGILGFSGGTHVFNDLRLDVRGIRAFGQAITPPPPPRDDQVDTPVADLTAPITLTLTTKEFSLSNSDIARTPCTFTTTVNGCGTTGNTLIVNATAVRLGSGPMATFGFDDSVTFNASQGIFVEGNGTLDVGIADFVALTPFIGDRALVADPRGTKLQPSLTVFTTGNVALSGPGANSAGIAEAPGATLAFGDINRPVGSFSAANIVLRATAGVLDVRATGNVSATGNTVLAAPGYSKDFGDASDKVTVSAPAGYLSLVSLTGDVDLGPTVIASVGGPKGAAGTLTLSAGQGKVVLPGTIDASAPEGKASLRFDSQTQGLDLIAFLNGQGKQFTGDVRIRTGAGNLSIADGQMLTATRVRLTADGGLVDIAGTIDTSGVNGGNIGLFGGAGVTLRSTALLDAHADGYGAADTRAATGGLVEIGTAGNGTIFVAAADAGKGINVSAKNTEARLVFQLRKDALTLNDVTTYNYAQPDTGGSVVFRAPVVVDGAGNQTVNIQYSGTITGADEVTVEGYRSYDLATLALGGCTKADICINDDGQAVLDLNATPVSRLNILATKGPGTIPDFIRTFDVSASPGLGALAAPGVRLRPGIQLEYAGDIVLASNWNLAAGTLDTVGAAALLGNEILFGNGLQNVLAGKEAELFAGSFVDNGVTKPYIDFVYRVDGVSSGEAPVLSFRAGGDVDLRGSVTDGFFTFADQTDPQYINYLLGGGEQKFRPTLNLTCSGSCELTATPFAVDPNVPPTAIPFNESIVVNINNISTSGARSGRILPFAVPYSAAANTPGALGALDSNDVNVPGDPIGSAALFPLLANGRPAASSDFRFVSGITTTAADPLYVAPASTASFRLTGTATYRASATPASAAFLGPLQLGNIVEGVRIDFEPIDTAGTISVADNTSGRLVFTSSNANRSQYFRDAFADFATANGLDPATDYQYFGGSIGAPNFVATSVDVIGRFLQGIADDFGDNVDALGYAPPRALAPIFLANPNIQTRSLIRTGAGSIDIAAAADVDLSNGRASFRASDGRPRNPGVSSGVQDGGTAIYTAGHQVTPGPQTAFDFENKVSLSIAAAFPAANAARTIQIANLQGVLSNEPVYATGGGDIRISSGRDVLARRDAWSESFKATINDGAGGLARLTNVGTDTQLWRFVSGPNTTTQRFVPIRNIRINPQLFSSGVGALGGGNVSVEAARNISELTAVSDTSITTGSVTDPLNANAPAALTLISYGGGNVDVRAGRDVAGSLVDAASGTLAVSAGGMIRSAGNLRQLDDVLLLAPVSDLLRVRVGDATAAISAVGSVAIAGITTTDGEIIDSTANNYYQGGQYSPAAGVSIATNGNFALTNDAKEFLTVSSLRNGLNQDGGRAPLLPGSLEITALFGNIDLFSNGVPSANRNTQAIVMVPSPIGQLRLYAGGNLEQVTLAMDDGDPSLTPGILSAITPALLSDTNTLNPGTRRFGFPTILPTTSDGDRRRLHNERTTHDGDDAPVRIFADGNINRVTLSLPKQARIGAGGDITDMVFIGQNITASDVTRITAGRDIIASSRVVPVSSGVGSNNVNLPTLQGNNFVLGGPGAIFIEAGRDLGPFFNSAVTTSGTYAGGVLTVGNDYNPWLRPVGAKLYAQFGVGKGAQFGDLLATYVDPANSATLDDDLFVQEIDFNGNRSPDPDKPIYDTALVGWLVEAQPAAAEAAFGAKIAITGSEVVPLLESLDAATRTQFLADLSFLPIGGGANSELVAIDRTRANAPVLLTGDAVAAAPAGQRTNISGTTLIGWLAQNAPDVLVTRFGVKVPADGKSYADLAFTALTSLAPLVQQQFLLDRVYFNELAAPSRPDGASQDQFIRGYRAVDTLFPGASGYTANNLDGTSNGGQRVPTGNLDLRLAALETQRGGDITILGPGGRVLGGSVVATSAQARRRGSEVDGNTNLFEGRRRVENTSPASRIFDIPTGFEGILTLRGGSVRGFTDGDFLLNQSRLFTLAGGDVTLWSSNGDLNAGQGAKTTANNPPVVIRFDPNGFGVLDQAGTVAGAGIAALTPPAGGKAPDVTLVAPVGTVDAGDAGVRASGNVFVAAAQVANADNFKVGGTAFGNIAVASVDVGAAASANAASAAAAQAAAAVNPAGGQGAQDGTRISVEVLGFAGEAKDDPCNLPAGQRPANCPVTR